MKLRKKYISILMAATFFALSLSAFAEGVPSAAEHTTGEKGTMDSLESDVEVGDVFEEAAEDGVLESSDDGEGEKTQEDVTDSEKLTSDSEYVEPSESDTSEEDEGETVHKYYVYPDIHSELFSINDSSTAIEAAPDEVVWVKLKESGYISVLDSCERFVDVTYDGRENDDYLYHFNMPAADVKVSAFSYDSMVDLCASNLREAIGSQLTVSYQDYSRTELDQAGYVISTAYFELSNGHWAMCCAHELLPPTAGTKMTVTQIYTAENKLNENIRKVMYYGVDGPGDAGYSWSKTALAVSVANGHGDSYFKLGSKVLAEISAKPSPPASFVVYHLSDGNNTTQDLLYWENKTISYIQIKKQFSGNNSYSYNPSVSPAIYGVYTDSACTKPYDSPYVDGTGYTYRIEANLMTGKIPVQPGIYYVKELQAPAGWSVDTNIYKIDASNAFDAASPAQTTSVNIPNIELKTSARSFETGDHIAMAASIKITDTVSYKWLRGNTQYTMKATAMNRSTGQPIKNQHGEATVTEKTFMSNTSGAANTGQGSVDVELLVDASGMEAHDIVIFEELMLNGKLQASHADLSDENQTIHIPGAQTTAKENNSGIKHAIAQKNMVITDTITYKNLLPGKTYKVSGILMDKATGKPLKTPDNKDITVEKEFKAASADGSVEVKFAFDGSQMAGKTIVVFEEVYFNGHLIAEHKDLQDSNQTIYVPDIGTTLVDKKSESHMAFAEKDMVLTDTITYKNLIPGKEYKVTGTLMHKETGKALEINGQAVTASATLVPEKSDGTTEIQFTFDGSQLKGQTVVAYETITMEGVEVAVHANLEDEAQMVRIPEIHTTAVNKENQTHEANENENLQIEDKVSYQNLVPGNAYTVTGFLVNQATGEAVTEKGHKVMAEKTFVAEQADGEVELDYMISGKTLKSGMSLVVYETLYTQEKKIAEHADINDANQTIHISRKDIPEDFQTPATGDNQFIEVAFALLVAATAIIAFLLLKKTRHRGGLQKTNDKK